MVGVLRRAVSPDRLVLWGVLLIAASLIFFRLTRADVQTDAGHYSLRAVGYLDFLDSPRQTTPLQWFQPAAPPAWTKLSFHDHPPLVFAIQHLFFRAFGVNDVVALLPFALAGVGSVGLLYAIGRRLAGERVGMVAAGLLLASTFFTWSSRIGYLEGIEQVFVLLAVWLWLHAFDDARFLPWWGVSLGAAVLTKYSALFLVPVFALGVLGYRRQWLTDRRFWAALAVAVLVLSPVIVYNGQVWASRGHLDVQLSTLVGSAYPAAKRDWPVLFAAPPSRNVAANGRDLAVNLWHANSAPFAAFLLVGVVALAWRIARGSREIAHVLPAAALVSLTLLFLFTAPSLRYLPIFVPWLVLPAALLFASRPQHWRGFATVVAGVAIVGVELVYNWNTNHAISPYGQPNQTFAAYRQEALGFQELERYLQPKLAVNPNFNPLVISPRVFDDWQRVHLKRGADVVLYDDGLLWFSSFWYLRRHRVYHQTAALMYPVDLVSANLLEDWPQKFRQAGIHTAYVVAGEHPSVYDPWAAELGEKLPSKQFAAELRRLITQEGVRGDITTIRSPNGDPAFTVYEIPLNP